MNWKTIFVAPAFPGALDQRCFTVHEMSRPDDMANLLSAIPADLHDLFIFAKRAAVLRVGLPPDIIEPTFSEDIIVPKGAVPIEVAIHNGITRDIDLFRRADTTKFPVPTHEELVKFSTREPMRILRAAPELQADFERSGCALFNAETMRMPSRRRTFVIRTTSCRRTPKELHEEIVQRIEGVAYEYGWRVVWQESRIYTDTKVRVR